MRVCVFVCCVLWLLSSCMCVCAHVVCLLGGGLAYPINTRVTQNKAHTYTYIRTHTHTTHTQHTHTHTHTNTHTYAPTSEPKNAKMKLLLGFSQCSTELNRLQLTVPWCCLGVTLDYGFVAPNTTFCLPPTHGACVYVRVCVCVCVCVTCVMCVICVYMYDMLTVYTSYACL